MTASANPSMAPNVHKAAGATRSKRPERRSSLPTAPKIELTAREDEVIRWVAEGKTNHEMARILACSPRTIAKHLQRIFAKLNVKNRTEAAVWWSRRHRAGRF
jgi:DNA-binding CsgD family transcriptional regulator